jgi:hypothetical protein
VLSISLLAVEAPAVPHLLMHHLVLAVVDKS